MASDLERFVQYARAFEAAYWADAWAGLAPFLHDDARHLVHGAAPLGADDRGREAMIAGLRESVHSIDRRFDVRIPEVLDGPRTRPDGVWMRFALTLRRAGVPDLQIRGEHLVRFAGDRIAGIEEWIEPGGGERVAAHLAEHADRLRPAGSPAAPPSDTRDGRDFEDALVRTLVRGYGCAKSERDVQAALALCSPDFALETVSFGLVARGRREVEGQLDAFFGAFPDYAVVLEGLATAPGVATCWGKARMTWSGPFLGLAPTHRTAEIPIFCTFPSANGLLQGERFFFDRASLCEQIGLPEAALQGVLAALRGEAAGAGVRGAA